MLDGREIVNFVEFEIPVKDLVWMDEEEFIERANSELKTINNNDEFEFEDCDSIASLVIMVMGISPCKQKIMLKVRGNLFNIEDDEVYTVRHGRLERLQ